jgi:hypothetical protein
MIQLFYSCILTNFTYIFFGKIFLKSNNIQTQKIVKNAIFGTIFISFFSLFLNFFFPLDQNINSIYLLVIIILFFLQKIKINIKEFYFLIFSSILTFSLIAFSNINRPDAGLYHLPFTQILNEYKIILGLSNFHSRFGHISIMQYLSASNFNYITGVNGVLIPAASIASFIYIYFSNQIIIASRNSKKINSNTFFCLFVSFYIVYKIINYTNFGNDDIAHLLLFYLCSQFLLFESKIREIQEIIILCIYIFLQKITLVLCFVLPIYLIFINKFKLKNIKILFASFFLFLWIIKNILISSCLIYPIKQTCIKNLTWNNQKQIEMASIEIEAWAKGWPENKSSELTQVEFIENLKWVKSWNKHFTQITSILLPYIIFIFILIIIINFKTKQKTTLGISNHLSILYFISLVGIVFSFFKFPIYRQGYSYIIILICCSAIVFIKKYNIKKLQKIFFISFYFFYIVFFVKQFHRYIYYYESRSLWPNIYSLNSKIDKNTVTQVTLKNGFIVYQSKTECMYIKSPCTHLDISTIEDKTIHSYILLLNKK